MAQALARACLLGDGAYAVAETLSFGPRGGVYEARHRASDRRVILKEVLLDEPLSDAQLREVENLAILLQTLEHPNLSRFEEFFQEGLRLYFVFEKVEGISADVLLGTRVEPLVEREALEALYQIAQAMAYLQDRPKPLSFGALTLDHLVVTPDHRWVLVDFGLSRLGRQRLFLDDPREAVEDLNQFARVARLLLTLQELDQVEGFHWRQGMSENTARLLNACYQARPGEHLTFAEVAQRLRQLLRPTPLLESAKVWPFQQGREQLLERSRRWMLRTSMLFLGMLLLGLLMLTVKPDPAPLQGPTAYVACGSRVALVSLESGRQYGQLHFEERVLDLALDEQASYLGVLLPRRLVIVLCRTGRRLFAHRLDTDVDQLKLRRNRAVVADRQSGHLAVLDKPLIPDSTATTWLSAGPLLTDLVVTDEQVLVGSRQGQRLMRLRGVPPSPRGTVSWSRPLALAGAPQVDLLGQAGYSGVTLSHLSTLTALEAISASAFDRLLFSPDGRMLWALSDSTLQQFDRVENRGYTVNLPAVPQQMRWAPPHTLWLSFAATGELRRVVDGRVLDTFSVSGLSGPLAVTR